MYHHGNVQQLTHVLEIDYARMPSISKQKVIAWLYHAVAEQATYLLDLGRFVHIGAAKVQEGARSGGRGYVAGATHYVHLMSLISQQLGDP
jgi:hypothetical protein